jgi:hypothetical protein
VELRGLREDLMGGRRRSLGLGLRNVRGGGGEFRRGSSRPGGPSLRPLHRRIHLVLLPLRHHPRPR